MGKLTSPAPEPPTTTASGYVVAGSNIAPTEVAALAGTVQVEVPEQAPDHPANCIPVSGVAVRVT